LLGLSNQWPFAAVDWLVTMRLPREAFVRWVTWWVLASGNALIGRYLST